MTSNWVDLRNDFSYGLNGSRNCCTCKVHVLSVGILTYTLLLHLSPLKHTSQPLALRASLRLVVYTWQHLALRTWPLPHLSSLIISKQQHKKSNRNKSHKVSELKHVHVGMEPSKPTKTNMTPSNNRPWASAWEELLKHKSCICAQEKGWQYRLHQKGLTPYTP